MGWSQKLLKILVVGGIASLIFLVIGVLFLTADLPSLSELAHYRPSIVTEVFSDDEHKIGEFYNERRYVIPYEKMPPLIVHAFIAAEDDRFFEHHGIDFQGILRALITNIKAREWKQGGSTISQQVARTLFLTRKKTIVRKIKEIILASTMEKHLSKKQILYLYFNQIYLGHGAHGVEAASHVYFGKSVQDLTLAEAAMLAGLPQAPSNYTPYHYPQLAKERQIYVLKRMKEVGYITETQMKEAIAQKLEIKKDFKFDPTPYFTEHVRRYLVEKYGNDAVLTQGLKVYTTLKLDYQKAAQESLKEGLRVVDKRRGFRGALKHLGSNEINAYLAAQHRTLVDGKYVTQSITSVGENKFGFYLDPKHYSEETPLDKNTFYDAVVTHINDESRLIQVKVGTRSGVIPFSDMRWARSVNSQVFWEDGLIRKPSEALKVGDVISVRVIEVLDTKDGIKFSLEQEPEIQGAILSVGVNTGQIYAMVGGYDYEKSEFNRATQAKRQVGSTFKPIIYAAALDKGYTPATVLSDAPIVYKDEETRIEWKPDNYGEKFYGDTTFRTALINSRNIPTINIVQDLGVDYILTYAKKLGVESLLNEDLSSALGSSSVTLLEMCRTYSVFANSGKVVEPVFIKKVVDRDENVLEEYHEPLVIKPQVTIDFDTRRTYASLEEQKKAKLKAEELRDFMKKMDESLPKEHSIAPSTAFIMTHLLEGVVQEGTGWKLKELKRPVAGKTGTTDNYEDAWFLGYTPDVVTGVWVGMDDKKESIGKLETGSSAAAPIWVSYMKEVVKNYPIKEFEAPEGIAFVRIDPKTGKLAAPQSKIGVYEAFKEGTEPQEIAEPQDEEVEEGKKTQEDDVLRGF